MTKVLELMAKTPICVLSTISADDIPQSAVVGFAECENYELIVGTSKESRKYKNILNNPNVSVVIGWDNKKTIQYEGLAEEITKDKLPYYQQIHFAKHPDAAEYKDDPSEVYILIKPRWIRYTDCNNFPWDIEVIRQFS